MNKYLFIVLLFSISCTGIFNRRNGIPDFNILMLDSVTVLNTNKIPEGEPIAMVFFYPDCDHCQEQIEEIIEHMDSLKNIRFYFISIASINSMRSFRDYYKLSQYSNVILGRDYLFSFPKYFEANTTPYTVISDKYKKIQLILKGNFKASQFIQEVNKF
jgi:thioredoxin-related protein